MFYIAALLRSVLVFPADNILESRGRRIAIRVIDSTAMGDSSVALLYTNRAAFVDESLPAPGERDSL